MKSYCHRCNATLDADPSPTCPECAAVPPAHGWPRDHRLGRLVVGGQYRVLRRLGAGGFGSVYLVETVVGGLRRALKVLNAEWTSDEEMRQRFVNEALVLEQVNHPNVARCYAAGTLDDENALYLLLELVEGMPLSRVLAAGAGGATRALSPARAVGIAKQVASGLVVAHANQVLHRDLKPENILITGAGTPVEQVKLVDFGIAKSFAHGPSSTGALLGTPRYMAPEQLTPGATLDRRLDLWQLGATLFLMLTGDLPCPPGSPDPRNPGPAAAGIGPAPSEKNPGIAAYPALDRLVARMLAPDPDGRPRSAAQVAEELARIEHQLAPGSNGQSALALLEALCAAPSHGAWSALCRYLAEETAEREKLVAAAETLLADWPDEVRRAATSWWDAVKRGEEHPLWPLARALDLAGRGLGDEGAAEVAACPALATISVLALDDNEIGNAGAATLAGSPRLAALRRLGLRRNRISSDGAAALAGSRHLARLEALDLSSNGLGPRGAEAIAAAGFALCELDLGDNDIQASGAAALAASDALGRLVTLRIGGNAVGSDGVGALAVSRTLTGLRHLDLSNNGVGAGGAAALALSANMAHLQSLSLGQNALGVQGVELLVASNRFGALESLDLSSNEFGARGAMVLASSPFARRLKALEVADNRLGDAGLAALVGAHHLSGLRRLGVAQNDLTAAGAALLTGAGPELDALDVSRNALGEAGAEALAAVLPRVRVTAVGVSDCGLGGEGLSRLVQAGGGRLASLEAARNGLGTDGARRFADTPEAAGIGRLDLTGNGLGVAGVEALGRSRHLKSVRALSLGDNRLGDGDAETLVRALDAMPLLQTLGLSANGLGPRATRALSASPLAARLGRLDLAHNALGDPGAEALAQGRNWHVLHELDLERNEISLGAAATVLASPGMTLLYRVNLAHNAIGGLVDLHSLSRRTVGLLESSFAELSAHGADFAERFYRLLFSRHPGVKPLFARTSMKRQQQHLLSSLAMVIENLRAPDAVAPAVHELGERHVGYGVFASHYQAVTSTMLEAIRQTVGDRWTEDVENAWHDGLEAVSAIMLNAHRQRAAAGERGIGDAPTREVLAASR